MNKYIFTFGMTHRFAGHHQVIYAEDGVIGQKEMIKMYGKRWAFMYTRREWEESRGYFLNSKAINPIYISKKPKNLKWQLVKENA